MVLWHFFLGRQASGLAAVQLCLGQTIKVPSTARLEFVPSSPFIYHCLLRQWLRESSENLYQQLNQSLLLCSYFSVLFYRSPSNHQLHDDYKHQTYHRSLHRHWRAPHRRYFHLVVRLLLLWIWKETEEECSIAEREHQTSASRDELFGQLGTWTEWAYQHCRRPCFERFSSRICGAAASGLYEQLEVKDLMSGRASG